MASPARGYVTDVEYTAGFIPETSPVHLAFAALCAKRTPGASLRPRRVLELGFGQGFGLALLAAANPDIAFEGCDLNPAHAAHARKLADDAGLANLTIDCCGFETFAGFDRSADVDVIVAHGVLSWVDAPTREAIVEIAKRRLSPQGVLYVSYNSLPGGAALAPLRRLILDVKRDNPGPSERQLDIALRLIADLRQANAMYFAANPALARDVDAMLAMDRAYLAHEYLSEHSEALAFADVAASMRRAGLSYAASATLTDDVESIAVHDSAKPLIARTADPVMRETLRDFAVNRGFRRDIYARAARVLGPDEWLEALSQVRFELVAPRSRTLFTFDGPLGQLAGKEAVYAPLADRLVEGAAPFGELLALAPFTGRRADLLIECLALLVHSGQVLPLFDEGAPDPAPAQRLNRVIAERAQRGNLLGYLAAPRVRTGIPVNAFDLLVLGAALEGDAHSIDAAAASALGMAAGDVHPTIDQALPIWQRLGVL